jgi:predicted phosphodiesterase
MALAEGVRIISALGQHDLPGHSLDDLPRSACGVLQRAGVVMFHGGNHFITEIYVSHFGEGLPNEDLYKVFLTHRMVIDGKQDWPGQQTEQAMTLLNQLPFCQLILTGDNHIPFVVQSKDKRLLVNPGSMMRMTAAQVSHRPRVYLWDAVASQVSPVYLPVAQGVIDRNHIEAEAVRDERMKAFTERIKMDYSVGVDYIDDLHRYFENNRTWDKTQQRVWEACEMGEIK